MNTTLARLGQGLWSRCRAVAPWPWCDSLPRCCLSPRHRGWGAGAWEAKSLSSGMGKFGFQDRGWGCFSQKQHRWHGPVPRGKGKSPQKRWASGPISTPLSRTDGFWPPCPALCSRVLEEWGWCL